MEKVSFRPAELIRQITRRSQIREQSPEIPTHTYAPIRSTQNVEVEWGNLTRIAMIVIGTVKLAERFLS